METRIKSNTSLGYVPVHAVFGYELVQTLHVYTDIEINSFHPCVEA